MTPPIPEIPSDFGQPVELDIPLALAGVPPFGAELASPPPPYNCADLSHIGGTVLYARQLAGQIAALNRQIKSLTKLLKPLVEQIKQEAGQADAIAVDGQVVATCKPHEQTRIVPELVRRSDPVVAASCTVKEIQRPLKWIQEEPDAEDD